MGCITFYVPGSRIFTEFTPDLVRGSSGVTEVGQAHFSLLSFWASEQLERKPGSDVPIRAYKDFALKYFFLVCISSLVILDKRSADPESRYSNSAFLSLVLFKFFLNGS
jgi:hypothetical protein